MKNNVLLILISIAVILLPAVFGSVFDLYEPSMLCELEPGQYMGSDRTTLGANWVGNYGSYAYILSAMNVLTANYEWPIQNGDSSQYDVTGGPGIDEIDYSVYTKKCSQADERALEYPDETKRRATCYWSSSAITINLNVPPGNHQLALYLLDWDTTARAEDITVTDSTGSASTPVAGFHDGVYKLFNVNGGPVTITITKTAGSNAVISGIFLDPSPLPGPVSYIEEDTTTKGNWVDSYGSEGYLLTAMDSIYTQNNAQPEDPMYDVKGGELSSGYIISGANYWAWNEYFTGGCTNADAYAWAWTADNGPYGLPGGSASWTAATWDDGGEKYPDGPDLYVDLTVPEGKYLLSFYITDYDSNCRKQILHLIDRTTGLEIAASPDELIGKSVYYTFFISGGEYTIMAEYTGCTNAIISGIFLDEVECDIDCIIEPGDFCTQTQGGWGTDCKGNNVGCLRDDNWAAVIGGSLVVGSGYTLAFTSASAVENYLPAAGTPSVLTSSHTDPLTTESGILGGQVTALKLNVMFSDEGIGLIPPENGPLGELYIAYGPFAGMTVYEFLELAEQVLGGDTSVLPMGTTVSDLNNAAASINEEFVDCEEVNGFLIIDPSCGGQPPATGMISGYVWDDMNKNMIWDPGEAIISGVTINLYMGGNLIATTTTDDNGYYEFTDLEPGMYTVVEINLPGWFSSTPNEVIAEVIAGGNTRVDFGDYMPAYGEGSGDFRTIGFWKHQFGVATGSTKGKAQIGADSLLALLGMLNEDWTTYEGTTLMSGYSLLNLKKASMEQRARQQCFATMLNYASGAVAWTEYVDTDYDGTADSMFGDAIMDALSGSDYENNKNICDSINNMGESEGNMITGGAVSDLGDDISETGILMFLGLAGIAGLVALHIFSRP